jgi:hypothetical protein
MRTQHTVETEGTKEKVLEEFSFLLESRKFLAVFWGDQLVQKTLHITNVRPSPEFSFRCQRSPAAQLTLPCTSEIAPLKALPTLGSLPDSRRI